MTPLTRKSTVWLRKSGKKAWDNSSNWCRSSYFRTWASGWVDDGAIGLMHATSVSVWASPSFGEGAVLAQHHDITQPPVLYGSIINCDDVGLKPLCSISCTIWFAKPHSFRRAKPCNTIHHTSCPIPTLWSTISLKYASAYWTPS